MSDEPRPFVLLLVLFVLSFTCGVYILTDHKDDPIKRLFGFDLSDGAHSLVCWTGASIFFGIGLCVIYAMCTI